MATYTGVQFFSGHGVDTDAVDMKSADVLLLKIV